MTIPQERYKDRPFIEAVASYVWAMVKANLHVHEISKRTRAVSRSTREEVLRLTKEIRLEGDKGRSGSAVGSD